MSKSAILPTDVQEKQASKPQEAFEEAEESTACVPVEEIEPEAECNLESEDAHQDDFAEENEASLVEPSNSTSGKEDLDEPTANADEREDRADDIDAECADADIIDERSVDSGEDIDQDAERTTTDTDVAAVAEDVTDETTDKQDGSSFEEHSEATIEGIIDDEIEPSIEEYSENVEETVEDDVAIDRGVADPEPPIVDLDDLVATNSAALRELADRVKNEALKTSDELEETGFNRFAESSETYFTNVPEALRDDEIDQPVRPGNALSQSVIEASVAALKASFVDQLPRSEFEAAPMVADDTLSQDNFIFDEHEDFSPGEQIEEGYAEAPVDPVADEVNEDISEQQEDNLSTEEDDSAGEDYDDVVAQPQSDDIVEAEDLGGTDDSADSNVSAADADIDPAPAAELLPISPVASFPFEEQERDNHAPGAQVKEVFAEPKPVQEPAELKVPAAVREKIKPINTNLEAKRQNLNMVRDLLDVMALPDGVVQPQERALAGDTLLRKLPAMPESSRCELSERVSMMENPPALIVSRLVADPNLEVAGPMIENAAFVSDKDLLEIIHAGDVNKCRMIARRRLLSPALASALVDCEEPSVLLGLVRNPEAALPPELLSRLAGLAQNQATLQAPLATRADMTPNIAFDLFWVLPGELRRFVFSRFLTDSKMLEKVLKIAIGVDDDGAENDGWDTNSFPEEQSILQFVSLTEQGMEMNAKKQIAELAHIHELNAERILDDAGGEPLTVVLKAMGLSRAKFNEVMKRLGETSGTGLSPSRDLEELRALFDSLSFNKARVVLTYWDWMVQEDAQSREVSESSNEPPLLEATA
ncbi:MAG: DUF2336 domain-containing protein [Hyphomicrobiales bacterium]